MTNDELIEELSEYAHNSWSGWMQYLFSKCERRSDGTFIIPLWAVDRWWRQMQTDYSDLPDNEKKSDRDEARKIMSIVDPFIMERIGKTLLRYDKP